MKPYKKLTGAELAQALSETAKYRHLTARYCFLPDGTPGCGVDIASQGDAVVPWAISFDLPPGDFDYYCSGEKPKGALHLRGFGDQLPFEDNSLDFVYSSHLLEDYLDWIPVLSEWVRVLKIGGHLIILLPDKELWAEAMKHGQSPNLAHKHESHAGELSAYAHALGLQALEDRLTQQFPGDYSILFAARKIADVLPRKPAADPAALALAATAHLYSQSTPAFLQLAAAAAVSAHWGVELGAFMGKSLLATCLAGPRLHIWGVDPFLSPGTRACCEFNLQKQIGQSRCELIPGDGLKAARMLPHMTGQLDLLTITGDWPSATVELDIQAFLPLLRSGGVIIGSGHPPLTLRAVEVSEGAWKFIKP